MVLLKPTVFQKLYIPHEVIGTSLRFAVDGETLAGFRQPCFALIM